VTVDREQMARLDERHNSCSRAREAKEKSILQAIQSLEGKVDKLGESINGNGKPGLKSRVVRAETLAWIAVLGTLGINSVEQIKPILATLSVGT